MKNTRVITPEISQSYINLTTIPLTLFLSWLISGFMIALFACVFTILGGILNIILGFGFSLLIIYKGIYWCIERRLASTVFRLGDHSIVHEVTFPYYTKKEIDYKNIKELEISQGIFQRQFNLYTVLEIVQRASKDSGSLSIDLSPISHGQEVFDYIQKKRRGI